MVDRRRASGGASGRVQMVRSGVDSSDFIVRGVVVEGEVLIWVLVLVLVLILAGV